MKKIVPMKIIIEFNADGSFKDGVYQYQIEVDGARDPRKFFTIGIKQGASVQDLKKVFDFAHDKANKAEGVK